jgi:hypothetical protein
MAHVTCEHVPFYIQIGSRGKVVSGKGLKEGKHKLLARILCLDSLYNILV